MRRLYSTPTVSGYSRILSNKPLLVGLAGGVAVLAGVAGASLMLAKSKQRRYSDRGNDRRSAINMFAAGIFPQRRKIDRSGKRPLFERRESAYESY